MTQTTALANLKCNSLELLKTMRLKLEGGICTDEEIKKLKENLIILNNIVYFNCNDTLLNCNSLVTSLNNCSVNQNTCVNLFSPNVTIQLVSGTHPYNLSIPLLTNVSYTWSKTGVGYDIFSNNNAAYITESIPHTCGQPCFVRCLLTNLENGCTSLKTIILNQFC
jgi:hypothetical protein